MSINTITENFMIVYFIYGYVVIYLIMLSHIYIFFSVANNWKPISMLLNTYLRLRIRDSNWSVVLIVIYIYL